MVAEQVQPDIFDPPCHKLKPDIQTGHTSQGICLTIHKRRNINWNNPTHGNDHRHRQLRPCITKPYPTAMKNCQWVKEEIEKLFTAKVIHSLRSSWSAPIIVVPKGDGGKRLVIDYCTLNKVTKKFTWHMPKEEDIFSKLNGAKYF